MSLLDAFRKTVSFSTLLQFAVMLSLLQGCAMQSWVVDRYSDFSKPKENIYSDPAEKFRVYDKTLGKMIALGRCAMNTKSEIDELIEFSAPNLEPFDDFYSLLESQQKLLKADRDKIRSVIRSTTIDPNNLLEPYSHVSGFAEVWYDSISHREWIAIDNRIEEHIATVEELTAETVKGYNQLMLENAAIDRESLMRPLFCASAIPLVKGGVKLDKPGYFEMAYVSKNKESESFNPVSWLTGFKNGSPSGHVDLVNKIHSYRDDCNCYSAAQSDYTSGGSRFYMQSRQYGESLCAATREKQLDEFEDHLRNFISTVNSEQLEIEDMLDRKLLSKIVEPFVEREDDPLPEILGSSLLETLNKDSDIFYEIAKVQYAHSRRAREEHNIKIARKTLTCLHDARARSAGNLYLEQDFISEES